MRPLRLAALALLAAPVAAVALMAAGEQPPQDTIDRAMYERIKAEGMQRSKVLEVFNFITNITGGRLPASPAHNRAAAYMRDKLTEYGLVNSHLEAFPFGRGWEVKKFTLELTAPRYFAMYGFPSGYSPSTKGVLTGTPIYIGDKTAAQVEAMGERIRGAILLAVPPQTAFYKTDRADPTATYVAQPGGGPGAVGDQARPVFNFSGNDAMLRRLGAGAILRPSPYEHGIVGVGSSRTTPADAVPSVTVTAEHYNMVLRMLQAGEPVQLRLDLQTNFLTADTNSYNVIAEIPGEDPVLKDQVVIVGAHLDSYQVNGATDNGDAAASLVEAARILKAIGIHPRRTIRFALWSAEEAGFLGGRAYVAQHLADSASRSKVAVYLNDDPGTGNTYGWFMAGNAAAKTIFDAWLEPLKDIGLRKNLMEESFTSEDGVFDGIGIPAITTIKDFVDYDIRSRHTNDDFFERVPEATLKQSAIVMATFAYQAAMRNEIIPRRPRNLSPSGGGPLPPPAAAGRGGAAAGRAGGVGAGAAP